MSTWLEALRIVLCAGAVACAGADDEGAARTESKTDGDTTMAGRPIETVLDEHVKELMAIPGVVGVGIGACGDVPCIHVMVSENNETIVANIPSSIEGHKTEIVPTGGFDALPDK